jgi:phosphatidylserine/phosphatidylglycerophosphate/cardiolipin synthase-like enzyme
LNWKEPLSIFGPLAVLALAAYGLGRHNAPSLGDVPPVQVYFSPNGGCSDAIIKQIGEAKSTIWVQAYSFTSTPIAQALLEAHKRGVKVEVILDKSQQLEAMAANHRSF